MAQGRDILMTVAQTAARLGVTPRALRLYERKGFITPQRTAAGWRLYGAGEIARLHQVLALKAMGFTLARIKTWLDSGLADLASVLAAQEEALIDAAGRAGTALRLVRAAREQLVSAGALSTDELITLIQETTMADMEWTDAHEALAAKHFSTKQRDELAERKFTELDQAESSKAWAVLIAQAEALLGGDPGAPEALDLARRWSAEVAKFTLGDTSVSNATGAMYQDAFSSPDTAALMPFSKEVWAFMGEACQRLKDADANDDGIV